MRLLQWAALRRDREQFIYNWMLEDDLDLEQGSWKDAKRTRGKTDKPGSHVGSRSGKGETGKRALVQTKSRYGFAQISPGSHAGSRSSIGDTGKRAFMQTKS